MHGLWWVIALAALPCRGFAADSNTPGLIEPVQKPAIRSTLTASIVAIHVDRGTFLKKGQTLVTLDASVESASLVAAKFRSVMQGQVAAAQARMEHGKAKLVIDSASVTFGARLEFANPNGDVPLGVRCSAAL